MEFLTSSHAREFINDLEIAQTLSYANKNKSNLGLINDILRKAKSAEGLDYREASVLLACDLPEKNEEIYQIAREIKEKFYGKRIVLFAPLYISNFCVNGCQYCPYHLQNKEIPRRKLSQEEIKEQVIALQDMGHKRLALEAGEHPIKNPIEYILESIDTIYQIQHKNGKIRRLNVNIAATTIENYRKLRNADIGTYILFQETYHRPTYETLHPSGPKSDYDWHTEAMDRAMYGGIEDVGLGVLFGLERYRYEFAALLMHAAHLERAFGIGPHTISIPRIQPAQGIQPSLFCGGINDDIFIKIIACIRLAVPYTGIIVSTRESAKAREKALNIGVSQISGGSRTAIGGYTTDAHDTDQFTLNDNRSLDEVVHWLIKLGYIPSFCTACYREGRTGDRFMQLCKAGQIQNCCQSNALMTLQEYLIDYASASTQEIGKILIKEEFKRVPSPKIREILNQHLNEIQSGERDFRF